MNDTIYRRDTIQALIDTEEIKGFAYRMLEDRLMEIPSADQQQVDGAALISAMSLGYNYGIKADRPQGWIDKAISIIDDMQREGIIDYEQAWEFRMRARMKGVEND